jgi:hypothetical protein
MPSQRFNSLASSAPLRCHPGAAQESTAHGGDTGNCTEWKKPRIDRLHGVHAPWDAARPRQGDCPRVASAQGNNEILDCLAGEERRVTAYLAWSEMRVAPSQQGQAILAGGALDRRGAFPLKGKRASIASGKSPARAMPRSWRRHSRGSG